MVSFRAEMIAVVERGFCLASGLGQDATSTPPRRQKKEPDFSGSVVTRSLTPSPRRSEG